MSNYTFLAANPEKASRFFPNENLDYSVRNNYQIDRDRILYSKAFRRLRGKTQIFIAGYDDHVRNRLSHTLEVSQIARTISNALGLNEMLTEAIALGHDLGHTPFGHVGERTLNKITYGDIKLNVDNFDIQEMKKGFKHNWQSVRVACDLEYHNRDYPGLNLTKETLWGFLHHSKLKYSDSNLVFYEDIYADLLPDYECWSFEGIVVSLADEIAQRHHDIEDGLITGILEKESLISQLTKLYQEIHTSRAANLIASLEKINGENYPEFYFEMLARDIVNFYVCEVVENTKRLFDEMTEGLSLSDSNPISENKDRIWNEYIRDKKTFERKMMSDILHRVDDELQSKYFKNRILLSHQAQKNDGKAAYVIKKIMEAYMANPQQMPDNAIIMLFANSNGEFRLKTETMNELFAEGEKRSDNIGNWREKLDDAMKDKDRWHDDPLFKEVLPRTIIDYVAGMTDDYALAIYEQLYGGTKKNRY